MAEKRMFANSVIGSDNFLEMPLSTQSLYFHLSMKADDDGFVDNPKTIMRMIGASKSDNDLLILKGYIIPFENGVCAIKDWKINNNMRSDRSKPTIYQKEKETLRLNGNGEYIPAKPMVYQLSTNCQPSDNQVTTNCQPSDNQVTTNCQPSDNQLTTNCQPMVCVDKIRLDKSSSSINILLSEQRSSPPIITLPLLKGDEFKVTSEYVSELKAAYPKREIETELNKMRAWLMANPTRRKTERGIKRFIVGWLNREVNAVVTASEAAKYNVDRNYTSEELKEFFGCLETLEDIDKIEI